MEVRSSEGLDPGFLEQRDRDVAWLGHRLAESLDSLKLVHRLCGEVGLTAIRARPHGDALDDQESGPLAEAARDVLQLNLAAATVRACALNRGRQ